MEKSDLIVILANGSFPENSHTRMLLDKASRIICCDEAADHLVNYGLEPDVIIGDMDSISAKNREKYKEITIAIQEQESNDLTKAVNYCIQQGYKELTILGATGLREDHTLGNISLLLEYSKEVKVRMVSDYGSFTVMESGEELASFPGEQISFFSIDNKVHVRSMGLKYPLDGMQLHNWWRASLNEVEGESFTLFFESEWPLILFRARAD